MGSWTFGWIRWLGLLLCCWGLASCGESTAPPSNGLKPGERVLGESCQQTEDCASLVCVSLEASRGVCSKLCEDDAGCPRSDNWACLRAQGTSFNVCGCRPLADREVCGDGVDNDCDGKVDDCRICGGEAVEDDDPRHCGACNNACRTDQSCTDSGCQCLLARPDACGGACVDFQVDPANCGACGTVCGGDQRCEAGECRCPSADEPDYCASVGCLNLSSNHDHCGECDQACDQGRTCSEGGCKCPSAAAPDFCDGKGCLDLAEDEQNCGECGTACRADQFCSDGSCACPAGLEECSGACVDTGDDRKNCGECGAACPAAQSCINGKCGCTAVGYGVCGEACVAFGTDPLNCGTCSRACATGENCAGGNCGCDSGVYCGATCMPDGDEQNCGACGTACPATQVCQGGTCDCSGAGLSPCGDACVDLSFDEQNCNACGAACRTGELCNYGVCACPAGQTYCASAGKCVPLGTDTKNCGACGNACDPTEVCSTGVCTCAVYGQLYCASVGACGDVQSNEQHCGSCDAPCKPTEVCNYGGCDCPGANEEFCANANACVNTKTDSKNCGGCGAACPANTHCTAGGCVCDAVGQTLCGTKCYDLTTSASNCSSCGKSCAGNQVCAHSTCLCPSPTVSSAVRVTNSSLSARSPSAVWNGTHVGVVYAHDVDSLSSNYSNIRFALLSPDGSVLTDVALTDYAPDQYEGNAFHNHPVVAWNGSEFGVAWTYDLPELTSSAGEVRFARVSASGVVSPSVVVATTAELPGGAGNPGLAWSVPGSTYAVAYNSSIEPRMKVRLIGAQGTSVGAQTLLDASGYAPVLATDAAGRWGMAWTNTHLYQTVLNPAATVAQPWTNRDWASALPNIAWDGTTFSSFYGDRATQRLLWQRWGAAQSVELVKEPSGTDPSSPQGVFLGSSLGVVWSQASGAVKFQRFTVPTTLGTAPTALDDAITIPTFAKPFREYALVPVGPAKLMLIHGALANPVLTELYANVITLPACP